LGEAW